MKRIFLLPCLLILFANAALAQPAGEPAPWQRYTVKGEEFSVMLPTHPAMVTRKWMVARLSKERQQRTLGAYGDGVAFTVTAIDNSSPRESLDEYIEQDIFTHSGWDRSSEKEVTLNGFKGKQYVSPNKIPGTMQIFATRNHIYRFHAFGATMEDGRVKQFFSSVVLGGKSTGIEVTDGMGVRYKSDASTAIQANETEFTQRDVDRRPFIAIKPEPNYTEDARKNAVAGSVILKVLFTAGGTITKIQVASGLPYGLTERAIAAARQIIFIPAMKDGKFVSAWTQLEYNFSLQ